MSHYYCSPHTHIFFFFFHTQNQEHRECRWFSKVQSFEQLVVDLEVAALTLKAVYKIIRELFTMFRQRCQHILYKQKSCALVDTQHQAKLMSVTWTILVFNSTELHLKHKYARSKENKKSKKPR